MLTVGGLFSGIGGFEEGFKQAGFDIIWHCEIDKSCQNILRRHNPGVKIYDDVRQVTKDSATTPDVLVGGFPCQDVSISGRREGLAGERSGLWFEFLRVIEELKPRWIAIENVPGLLSSNNGQDMFSVTNGLAKLGYWWAYRILDAQYFGVPQRRRRVFIIGSLGNGCCSEILFEANDEFLQKDDWKMVSPTLSSQAPVDNGGGGWLHGFVIVDNNLRFRNVTPVECERLQGFKDNYTDGQPNSTRYRQLGNAVCVKVSRWIAKRIKDYELLGISRE